MGWNTPQKNRQQAINQKIDGKKNLEKGDTIYVLCPKETKDNFGKIKVRPATIDMKTKTGYIVQVETSVPSATDGYVKKIEKKGNKFVIYMSEMFEFTFEQIKSFKKAPK